jgi:hypothetical protein
MKEFAVIDRRIGTAGVRSTTASIANLTEAAEGLMDGRDQGWKLIGCDLVTPGIGGDGIRDKLATLGRIVIVRHVLPLCPISHGLLRPSSATNQSDFRRLHYKPVRSQRKRVPSLTHRFLVP